MSSFFINRHAADAGLVTCGAVVTVSTVGWVTTATTSATQKAPAVDMESATTLGCVCATVVTMATTARSSVTREERASEASVFATTAPWEISAKLNATIVDRKCCHSLYKYT